MRRSARAMSPSDMTERAETSGEGRGAPWAGAATSGRIGVRTSFPASRDRSLKDVGRRHSTGWRGTGSAPPRREARRQPDGNPVATVAYRHFAHRPPWRAYAWQPDGGLMAAPAARWQQSAGWWPAH